MSIHELEAKAKELMEIRAQLDELEAQKTALEDAIKMAMAEAGQESIKAGAYSMTWKVVTSNRFDTTAFKKAMPELAAQYTKEARSCRFTINQAS